MIRVGLLFSAMVGFHLAADASGANYSLDLSGVTQREHMQDWNPEWISEVEDLANGYQFQVDPENGGQVGVWTGNGNPTITPGNSRDYSQFIAAGPPAGEKIRVRMRFEHRDSGSWVSCSHVDDSLTHRAHYEVSLQSNALRIYKFWGPGAADWASVASHQFFATQGAVYWIYLTETRMDNAVGGAVTIDGELFDENLNSLATISVTDTGELAGEPLINSSNKRGFGSYSAADGNGVKIFEWHVEAVTTLVDYTTWQSQVFPPETATIDTLEDADPDEDGLANIIEFYLGLNPLIPDQHSIELRFDGGDLIASYSRKMGRIVTSALVEYSEDLSSWSGEGVNATVVESVGDMEQVETVFPALDTGSVRLAVEP